MGLRFFFLLMYAPPPTDYGITDVYDRKLLTGKSNNLHPVRAHTHTRLFTSFIYHSVRRMGSPGGLVSSGD